MRNEMGNNNTSGIKEEDNNADKASWVISTLENGTTEEHQLVPEVDGEKYDKVANLDSNDPKRIGDPCVENQTSSIEVHQNNEAHPLDETPKITTEPMAAEFRDSNLQLEPSLNDSLHEKPIKFNIEESELQGTMQHQIEKNGSFKNEEDGTISTSDYLEPKESALSEAGKASLLDSTQEIDRNEENQIPAEVEVHVFYEEVAYSATDDQKMMEDLCIENLTSTKDLEKGEDEEDEIISKSDDFEPKENVTAEACETFLLVSTPENEANEKIERVAEVEQNGCHENIAHSAIDEQEMIVDSCIENQTTRRKDGEVPQHTLELTKLREENSKVQPEMLSSDAGDKESIEKTNKDYVIQDGTMQFQFEKQVSLKEENDEDGTISTPQDLEVQNSKSFESNQLEFVAVPADQYVEVGSGTLDIKECQGTNFASDFEAYDHVLDTGTRKSMELGADSGSDPVMEAKEEALEDHSETKDGEDVENGVSYETLPSSYDHVGIENNKYNVDLQPSSSHFEVTEPKDQCIVLEEEIRLPDKESENEEAKHHTNHIQPCILSRMDSEPDCDKSSGATIIEPTHEESETVSMINPLCNIECQTEEPKFVEADKLVHICLADQHEASEDQLTIQHLSYKEDESIGNITAQEKENNAELAIEMENINDSIKTLEQDNAGDFSATENPIIDFTKWIAEALVSMNNLEAEMLGQQVTQHLAKVAAEQESGTSAGAEISSLSTTSGSETQQTAGRSSTVSAESDTDNSNIFHAQIQKSPSFSLDLPNEAKTEESDSTPLLLHEKYETVNTLIQCEKVITFQRSESTTPFLGEFLKQEEEIDAAEKNHSSSAAESSTKNVSFNKNKGKEKRKHCPSVFSNCFCCSSVAN